LSFIATVIATVVAAFVAAFVATVIAEPIAKPIDLEPVMIQSRIDHLITGGLCLAVLALVVAVVPIEDAAPPARDAAAFGFVDRSPVAGSESVGEAAPEGAGAVKEEEAEAEAEEGASPPVVEGRVVGPFGAGSGSVTGMGMAMGLFTTGMVVLALWATAISWRMRARPR
jgi:hypothetical protein